MKRYTLSFALVGLLVGVSPALAGVVYTPVPIGPTSGNSIGLIDPNNPGTLNTVYVTSGSGALLSDTFVFTFGLHLDRFFDAEWLHFGFLYDNSSIEVLHAQPVGQDSLGQPWRGDNYGSATDWPDLSSGLIIVSSLSQNMGTQSSFFVMDPSVVYPFFQVTLHVKSAHLSQLNVFGVNTMTAKHHFITTDIIGPGMWTYWGGVIHEVPEPTTALLLGAAVAVAGGRVVRRRRAAA